MPESKLIKKFPRGGRLDRRPAGYSFLTRKLDQREKLKIIRYLSGCRAALLSDLGGESNLSAQKLILIDRLISLLGVLRGIEMFHQENIMNNDGSLKPALGRNYLAYVNSCRLILTTLGLDRKGERLLTPLQLAEMVDREEEGRASK